MKNEQNAPKIRFKGFTDAWELRKFSDFTFLAGEKNKNDLPLEPYAITNEHGFIAQSEAHDDFGYMQNVDRTMYIIVKPKSFAYNPARINVGSLGYYKGEENVIVSSLYEVFQTVDYVDDTFLNQWFKTKDFMDWISRLQEGSVRQYFYYDKLCECKMYMPSSEEQRQIGAYFRTLDHLITLHQRKCETLQKLKKSMLQKMFPKNGSYFPEIRFAGFTDAWELRTLGEIANRITRKNQNLESTLPLTISAQYGLIDQNEFFDKRIASKDVSGYYLLKKGEFAYNKSYSSDAPWGAVKRLDKYENGVLSTLYIIFEIKDKTKTDSDFIVSYYDTDRWHKEVQSVAAEGARNHGLLNISPNDFFETVLTIPKSAEEQRQIGAYFRTLDHLITLHQRKPFQHIMEVIIIAKRY